MRPQDDNKRARNWQYGLTGLVAIGCGLPALAEETTTLEEITVTASRRAETVQSLPASISALSGEELREMGIQSSTDVAAEVPNVVYRSAYGFSQPQYYIRGLGNRNFQTNTVSPVAVYSDGVVMGSSLSQSFQALDLERVEVLRGPQGTLYGRNASAGLLNFISQKPDPAAGVDGYADLTYGRFEEVSGDGALNIPLTDNLALRGAVAYRTRDGFFQSGNPDINRPIGDEGSMQYRTSLRYVTDNVELLARMRGGWIDNDERPYKQLGSLGPAGICPSPSLNGICHDALGFVDSSDPYQTFLSFIGKEKERANGADVSMTWHLSPTLGLYYVGAYDTAQNFRHLDEDFSPAPEFGTTYDTSVHFTSQELRLQTNTQGMIDWILGAYYYGEGLDQWYGAVSNPLIGGGLGSALKQETRTSAAFGNVQVRLSSAWSVRAGVRVTQDKRIGSVNTIFFDGTGLDNLAVEQPLATARELAVFVPATTREKQWTEPTGDISVAFAPTAAWNLYALYSLGFKGGDFNGGLFSPSETVIVNPEFVRNVEVGAKGRSSDGRFSVDLSVFRMRISDQQVSSIINVGGLPALTLGNAAMSRLQGLEVDFSWKVWKGLTAHGSWGFLDAKFLSYPNAPNGADYTGNTLAYAPRTTLNLALRYDTSTRFGDLTTEVSARYVSKEYDQPSDDPTLIVGSYGYADAFVGFTPKHAEHWNFKVWSKNIADRHYVATFYNGAGLGWNGLGYADPRTFGLTASYRIK